MSNESYLACAGPRDPDKKIVIICGGYDVGRWTRHALILARNGAAPDGKQKGEHLYYGKCNRGWTDTLLSKAITTDRSYPFTADLPVSGSCVRTSVMCGVKATGSIQSTSNMQVPSEKSGSRVLLPVIPYISVYVHTAIWRRTWGPWHIQDE